MNVICFDLDGTLSDPKLGITRSIQHALRELGRPVPTADDLIWCIGPPGIYGSEFDGTRSDKSELLGWVVAQERLSPAKTVMVGDRSHDIAGGRKNGMATLGVLYGYGTMAELLEAGADDLCQSPTDLTLHLCG